MLNLFKTDGSFIGPQGPKGEKGEMGTITNLDDVAKQLLQSQTFTSSIGNGVLSVADFNNFKSDDYSPLKTDYNVFKKDVQDNYVKATNSTWWNTQLKTNFNLYKPNEPTNDNTVSPYVWNNFYTKAESDGKFAKSTDLTSYAKTDQLPDFNSFSKKSELPDLTSYAKTDQLPDFNSYAKTDQLPDFNSFSKKSELPDLTSYAKTDQLPDLTSYVKNNTDVNFNKVDFKSLYSNSSISELFVRPDGNDFALLTTKPGVDGGSSININPVFNGKVRIGYNPNNFWPGLPLDTNIPTSRLAVKGDINASGNLIGNGLNIGSWNISQDGNKLCFNNSSSGLNIKKCFGDEQILTYVSNQSSRIINTNINWKLNEESQIISFENAYGSQGDANLNVNIWLNLSNYSFNKIELKIASHLGRVTVIQTPASNSNENIKTLTPSLNFGSEQTQIFSYESTYLNPVSKVICIQVSKSNDYYWFRLLKVTLT